MPGQLPSARLLVLQTLALGIPNSARARPHTPMACLLHWAGLRAHGVDRVLHITPLGQVCLSLVGRGQTPWVAVDFFPLKIRPPPSISQSDTSFLTRAYVWRHCHEPLVALDSHCAERCGLRYQGEKNPIHQCEHICVCLTPTCKEEYGQGSRSGALASYRPRSSRLSMSC